MTKKYKSETDYRISNHSEIYLDGVKLMVTGRCVNCYGLRRFTIEIRTDDLKRRKRDTVWICSKCKESNVGTEVDVGIDLHIKGELSHPKWQY